MERTYITYRIDAEELTMKIENLKLKRKRDIDSTRKEKILFR